MNRSFKKPATVSCLILACLFLASMAAAPATAIGVTGAKYTGNVTPGGSDVHKLVISISPIEDPADVQLEVDGFGQNLDKGYVPLDAAHDTSPYSARTFITLDKTSVHIEPGTSQVVNATINLPSNVGAGGRYALIYAHAVPGAGKTFTTAIIVPVFITVADTALTETGSITGIDVADVTAGQPITITTSLKNTGNYHYYRTSNQVKVTDANGNVVAQNSTPPTIYAIIPGNTVGYIVQPPTTQLPVGTYTVESKVLLEDGRVLDTKTTTFQVKSNYVPPPTETSITLTPASPGTLASSDGRYSVAFPQGSVTGDVVVTLKPYPKEKLNPAPADAKLGASSFEVAGLSGLLLKPATVQVIYSADDLAVAGGDATQLKIAYWDAGQGAWAILPTQLNPQTQAMTASSDRMGIWTVMISATSGTAPGGVAPLPAIPVTLVLGIVVLIVIIIAVAVLVVKKRQKK